MINTAPCKMILMQADLLRGQVGGGLGPVKWHRANTQVPFGAQKTEDF
jgi:hypothetical protein